MSVVVVTNGAATHFKRAAGAWSSEYQCGKDLFFCGPREKLLAAGIAPAGVIDYVDPPGSGRFFQINHKKYHALRAVEAEYIYLVHDRFIPRANFKELLERSLRATAVDFGCVTVLNEDGSSALNELRLRKSVLGLPLEDALMKNGRLVCDARSALASDRVGLNGGQFFIRSSLRELLSRPLRWFEMEDDVLSHDLQGYTGRWVSETHLLSLNSRRPTFLHAPLAVRARYFGYKTFCNVLTSLLGVFAKPGAYVSVGRPIGHTELEEMLERGVCLVDPAHKIASSDWLPSALEKLMARARLRSGGGKWEKIVQTRIGWTLR